MLAPPAESDVLEKLVAWGTGDDRVRALVLTSTRTRPGGPVDLLSDYDVIAAVTDVEAFASDDGWTHGYGPPMVRWGDEHVLHGERTYFRGVVYTDGVKIDWTLWPHALVERIADSPLPEELDVGYRVLLDKDGGTAGWPRPTYRAHIPTPPTEAEYAALVEEFWWGTTYAAKALWRGELFFASFVLDVDLKHVTLRRLLEWRLELDREWSVKPGAYGRGLERLVPPDVWHELAPIGAGASTAEGWEALERLSALFRRVAADVGDALGYAYPRAVDAAVGAYVEQVRELPAKPSSP